MWTYSEYSLRLRSLPALLLSLLLLLASPAVVQATTEPEASVPDCVAGF